MSLDKLLGSDMVLSGINHKRLDRIVLAKRVGQYLCDEHGSEQERHLVEDIARMLADDVSAEVRASLAFELRRAKLLPKDIACKIAKDIGEVSAPFLASTELLSDEDMAGLVAHVSEKTRSVIARRSKVAEQTSTALATHGGDKTVTYLVRNPGARIPEPACHTLIDRFGDHQALMDHLVGRGDLPLTIVHRLIDRVSEAARDRLVNEYKIPESIAAAAVGLAKGQTILKWIEQASDRQITQYMRDLRQHGALSDHLVLDMTRRGSRRYLEMAMAERSGVPVRNVQAVLREGGDRGIQRLLEKAGVAAKVVPAFAAALTNLTNGKPQ